MNLFRSEEHVRNFSGYKPGAEEALVPLSKLMEVFSGSYFRRRLDLDYVSKIGKYGRELVEGLGGLGDFWSLG